MLELLNILKELYSTLKLLPTRYLLFNSLSNTNKLLIKTPKTMNTVRSVKGDKTQRIRILIVVKRGFLRLWFPTSLPTYLVYEGANRHVTAMKVIDTITNPNKENLKFIQFKRTAEIGKLKIPKRVHIKLFSKWNP